MKWTELDRETQAVDLATVSRAIGLDIGLTLGGFGWLSNKNRDGGQPPVGRYRHSGRPRAQSERHAERGLFWACAAAAATSASAFGIGCIPVGPMIVGGGVCHPLSAGVEMLKFFQELSDRAGRAHGHPGLADQSADRCSLAVAAQGRWTKAKGDRAAQEIRHAGPESAGTDPSSSSRRCSTRRWRPGGATGSGFSRTSAAIDRDGGRFLRVPAPMSMVLFVPISGAAGRVPVEATAFPHRNGVQLGIYGQRQHDAVNRRGPWSGLLAWDSAVRAGRGIQRSMRTKARIAFGCLRCELRPAREHQGEPLTGESVRLNANVRPGG